MGDQELDTQAAGLDIKGLVQAGHGVPSPDVQQALAYCIYLAPPLGGSERGGGRVARRRAAARAAGAWAAPARKERGGHYLLPAQASCRANGEWLNSK